MRAKQGDKVRIKSREGASSRGVVLRVDGKSLVIQTEQSKEPLILNEVEVTNFSMAARKAWVSSPNRAVGRKKGARISDRVSVTLRIDREVWVAFQESEETGVIKDRTATINAWFRDKLAEINCVER